MNEEHGVAKAIITGLCLALPIWLILWWAFFVLPGLLA